MLNGRQTVLVLATVQGHCAMLYFSSNLRTVDHAPAVPSDAMARTLHHIVVVGNAEIDTCETVTVRFDTSGDGNVSLFPIWML